MMIGVGERIRSVASAGIAGMACGALALIGLVWLTIAIVSALTPSIGALAAQALVGVALMIPLLILVVRSKLSRPTAAARAAYEDPDAAAMIQVARLVETMGAKSPLASAGVALAAGVLAARLPTILPLFVQIVTQAMERRGEADHPPSKP
jgi:hypothetical protein